MTSLRVSLAAAAATCLLALPAVAAPPKAPPASEGAKGTAAAASPDATELARLLVTRETWSQGMQQLEQQVQSQLQSHPGAKLQYPADMQQKVRAEVQAMLPYDELIALHARELGASYSAPELKELLAFHRTPVGKKWLQQQPKGFENVAQKTQQQVEQKMPGVMQRLSKMAKSTGGAQQPPGGGAPPSKI